MYDTFSRDREDREGTDLNHNLITDTKLNNEYQFETDTFHHYDNNKEIKTRDQLEVDSNVLTNAGMIQEINNNEDEDKFTMSRMERFLKKLDKQLEESLR